MRYKVFLTAFVSLLLAVLPQKTFTCGATEDPYDYYTSFFSNSIGAGKAYEPFYYTALLDFYDGPEPYAAGYEYDRVIQEWKDYAKSPEAAAVQLVYKSGSEDLLQLKESVENSKPLPKLLNNNSAANYLVKNKNGDAVSYLAFAKKVEAVSAADTWSDNKKDSANLDDYITEANAAFAKATDPFFKNKWAFQRCKLAFYSGRFADCIRWYDDYFTDANTAAVMQLALSYKGGSQLRSGQKKEAAYSFCKAFPLSGQNKKDNFHGFLRATDNCNPALIPAYTALCKNNPEKANMLGLFALHGTDYKLEALRKVYELNPSSALLPLLATREINKLEEQYFTPVLDNEKGGKALYTTWGWRGEDENGKPKPLRPEPVMNTAAFFEKLMNDQALAHRGLYGAGAAYLHFMTKDYARAKSILAATKDLNPDAKVKDQLALISLLIVANEGKTVTPETEAQLLPAVKWLVEKAKKDAAYALFCRNFFSEILARKYEQQADIPKAALAYGMADLSFVKRGEHDYYFSYPPAIDFIRNEMNTAGLLKLYDFTTAPGTETVKYFVQHSSLKRDAVVDVIGTSYLRDGNYPKAIEWLSKAGKLPLLVETQYNYETGKEKTVNVEPLFDYVNDWQRLNKSAVTPYTKLTLAQKLLELQTKAGNPAATGDKSKICYQLASALYNMSYYGNSWNAVAYNRSSGDWNEGHYKQSWEKEYYGVYKAKAYYQKAYEAAADKEFKASCLFMVIKCAQRQLVRPEYNYKNPAESDKQQAAFERKYKYSPLFAKFKTEFGATKFYQYAYNRCSYLRDYVQMGGSTGPTVTPKSGKQ